MDDQQINSTTPGVNSSSALPPLPPVPPAQPVAPASVTPPPPPPAFSPPAPIVSSTPSASSDSLKVDSNSTVVDNSSQHEPFPWETNLDTSNTPVAPAPLSSPDSTESPMNFEPMPSVSATPPSFVPPAPPISEPAPMAPVAPPAFSPPAPVDTPAFTPPPPPLAPPVIPSPDSSWQLPPASTTNPDDQPLTMPVNITADQTNLTSSAPANSLDLPPAFPAAPMASPPSALPDSSPFSPTPRPAGPADHPVDLPLGGEASQAEPSSDLNAVSSIIDEQPLSSIGQPNAVPTAPLESPSLPPVPVAPALPTPPAGPTVSSLHEEPRQKANWLVWVAVVVVVVLVVVGGFYLVGRNATNENEISTLDEQGNSLIEDSAALETSTDFSSPDFSDTTTDTGALPAN